MSELKIKYPVCDIQMPAHFDDYAIPVMSVLGNKIVLTGSLSLKLLGVPSARKELNYSDFDFGLREPLTLNEYSHFKDFFELESSFEEIEKYDAQDEGREPRPPSNENELENRLIQLLKVDNSPNGGRKVIFKMDIFNFDYISPKNIIDINYKGYLISVVHPSITISYKAKYAFQHYGSYQKHFEDLKFLIENYRKYRRTIIPLWENKHHDRTISDKIDSDECVINF